MKNKNIKEYPDNLDKNKKYIGEIGLKDIELTEKEWKLLAEITYRIFCNTGLKLY